MRGIDDEGAIALANGLICNAPLKELELNYATHVTHIGLLAILAALQSNSNCRLQTAEAYSATPKNQ